MSLRSLCAGACALVATYVAAAPVSAAGNNEYIFDSVDGDDVTADSSTVNVAPFKVTGLRRGQAQPSATAFSFRSDSYATNLAGTCERFARMTMRSAGHYAFIVVVDSWSLTSTQAIGCRVERR